MMGWLMDMNMWCSNTFGEYWSMENPITFLLIAAGTYKLVNYKTLWNRILKGSKLPYNFIRYKTYTFWHTFIPGAAMSRLASITTNAYSTIIPMGTAITSPIFTIDWDKIKIELQMLYTVRITLPIDKWASS